jgi:uncharacterized membrane protein YeaQ/YmgE (transglycosylase-associated protein family)
LELAVGKRFAYVAFTAAGLRRRALDTIAKAVTEGFVMGGIIWVIIIGFIAGIIAKFLMPGPNNPSGFILTTVLGIVGAFIATFIGQAIGHYGPDQGAGLITATLGAVIVLFIWHRISAARSS